MAEELLSHCLADLAYPDIRAYLERSDVILIPMASLEQHGPHLPVEVDSMLGETVALEAARRVAAKGEPILVLPMLWTGLSEHHMSFGGTITLDDQTFLAVLRCIVKSVVRHGFRRIVLLNGHGGNDNAMRVAADMLTPEFEVPIVQFTYWYAAAEPIAAILETQKGLRHACEAETSMMMALRPELVARDRIPLAKANVTPEVSDLVGGGMYRWRTLGAMSSSGVMGNPEAATPEKGERLIAGIADELARKLLNKDFWTLPFLSEPAAS